MTIEQLIEQLLQYDLNLQVKLYNECEELMDIAKVATLSFAKEATVLSHLPRGYKPLPKPRLMNVLTLHLKDD